MVINPDKESLINHYLPADYTDAFGYVISSSKPISAKKIAMDFFTQMPGWVHFLFKLRNLLVKPFGLDEKELFADLSKLIIEENTNEAILCANDKHLVFYLSVFIQTVDTDKQKLTCTTVVNFNNTFGKIYFFLIKPFHMVIVPAMIKYTLKKQTT